MGHYDAIVIGGGPGGYIAAERLGQAGRQVLLAEKDALGGTCLNVGCIPTKSLLNTAKLYAHCRAAAPFGVDAAATVDWPRAQAWKAEVVAKLVAGVGAAEKRAGVTVARAPATLLGPGRVEVAGAVETSDHVIIATGSVPARPPIPGTQDNPQVVDSTGLLAIEQLPTRLAVIGGGVIGVEFASLFAALGVPVDVIEMLPEICPFMDAELAAKLRRALTGVTVHTGCQVQRVEGGRVVFADAAGKEQQVAADLVLLAVGRRPRVDGWGAREAGLDVTAQGVTADATMRTNLPNVWAVGDVTGQSLLAHAAYRMGEIAAAHILDPAAALRRGQRFRRHTVPWAVYSLPEAAGVGLTQAEAEQAGHAAASVTVPLALSGRFVAEHGFRAPGAVKLVADRQTRAVLGVHLLGPAAPEQIWGAALALELEVTVDDLRETVFPHPTVSEGLREAAWAWEPQPAADRSQQQKK
ncbi:MAG: dihydrolipoyl dehydrogenase [Propionibacteriaceae bacterium]|jgi:dihydrolipoamide dehydrogenase|nr:dihydrolipoyl dehydrogenase [Propionibacteriaceae bacterium]